MTLKCEYELFAEEKRFEYPYEYKAPYDGIPTDVNEDFVWIPFKSKNYSLFLFKLEEARDAFAAGKSNKKAA